MPHDQLVANGSIGIFAASDQTDPGGDQEAKELIKCKENIIEMDAVFCCLPFRPA